MTATQTWTAFECPACSLVADVRHEACDAIGALRCPRDGGAMEAKASWPADENGYGSRGDAGGQADEEHGEKRRIEQRAHELVLKMLETASPPTLPDARDIADWALEIATRIIRGANTEPA